MAQALNQGNTVNRHKAKVSGATCICAQYWMLSFLEDVIKYLGTTQVLLARSSLH